MKQIWLFSADRWGVERADRYLIAIRSVIAELPRHYHRGRRIDGVDDRFLFTKSGRHLVVYRLTTTTIHVARVLYDGMDARRHLS